LLTVAGCSSPSEENPESQAGEALTKVCGTGKTVPGLDISYYEGDIDFVRVYASGQRWIIARTNDGTFVDSRFVDYYKKAKAAGLIVGAYMFYRVGTEHDNPGRQVGIMLDLLDKAGYDPKTDLPPTLDVEGATFATAVPRAPMIKEMRAVLAKLEAKAGRKPMIYTNSAWENNVGDSSFGDYPLWAAQYNLDGSASTNCPKIAATGARTWTFWQHCMGEGGDGQCQKDVPGVDETRPDQNVFNGTMAELTAFVRNEPDAGTGADDAAASPSAPTMPLGHDTAGQANSIGDPAASAGVTPASPAAPVQPAAADGCAQSPARSTGFGAVLIGALALAVRRRRAQQAVRSSDASSSRSWAATSRTPRPEATRSLQ
jgi:lysozyme